MARTGGQPRQATCKAPNCNTSVSDNEPYCKSCRRRSENVTSNSAYGSGIVTNGNRKKRTFAMCCRSNCPCTASYSGAVGEYCCRTCKDGTACARKNHVFPQSWASGNQTAAGQPSRGGAAKGDARGNTRSCSQDTRAATSQETWQLAPPPRPAPIAHGRHSVCAFYYPQKETEWDEACGCSFLGNFYPADICINVDDTRLTFRSAEAAFQALKFPWCARAFSKMDGLDAFTLKRALEDDHAPDKTFSGHGSNWQAMEVVLKAKFRSNDKLANALCDTGNSFLLEHSSAVNRERFWSDNGDGSGMNALGLRLMLIRGELRKLRGQQDACSDWLRKIFGDFNTDTPRPIGNAWRAAVQNAADRILEIYPLEQPSERHSSRRSPERSRPLTCWREPHKEFPALPPPKLPACK
ncbi:unnamed protein product, partial [Symbiodinium sp. CCMP2592]